MAISHAKLDHSDPRPWRGEVVRRPRATDAIGASLRETFGGFDRVPSEWLTVLDKLDRTS